MPDTGAPWNIPYVDPTDLVRDYPQASEDLADAVAAGLSAAGNAGIGTAVVQTVLPTVFTTTSTTNTDVTGLAVTITPTSATSKVLIILDLVYGHDSGGGLVLFQLVRGATDIAKSSAFTRDATFSTASANTAEANSFTVAFLDSPGVATATTYKVQARTVGGTLAVNQAPGDTANGSVSIITAIEVAA